MNETFDDDVLRAIAKWPNVPACYGWLQLDRRGHWLIKGARITHARAVAFLNRNYARDTDGAWFVQNGPQRVYCELAYTPWIYRLDGHNAVVTHTDLNAREISGVYVDEHGNVLLTSEHGVGLLDDRDIVRFAESLSVPGEPHSDPAERLASLATGSVCVSHMPSPPDAQENRGDDDRNAAHGPQPVVAGKSRPYMDPIEPQQEREQDGRCQRARKDLRIIHNAVPVPGGGIV